MKKIFIAVTIFVLILLVGVVWWWVNRVSANEFVGKIQKVESNQMTLSGVYVVKDRPDLSNPSNSKTVSVIIDPNTKLIKEMLFLPTAQEVEKTGGFFKPDELKRETVAGSLEDFKTSQVSVRVLGVGNIYGKKSFTALEIRYIEPVYPD
ncbi:MAG: hypothetical protein AAB799_00340 [Patescibacteria group bacterium]